MVGRTLYSVIQSYTFRNKQCFKYSHLYSRYLWILHSLSHQVRYFSLQYPVRAPLFCYLHSSGLAGPSSGLSSQWTHLRKMGYNNAITTTILYYVLTHTVIRGLVWILCVIIYVEIYTKFLQTTFVSFLRFSVRYSSRPSSLLMSPLDTASKSILTSNLLYWSGLGSIPCILLQKDQTWPCMLYSLHTVVIWCIVDP